MDEWEEAVRLRNYTYLAVIKPDACFVCLPAKLISDCNTRAAQNGITAQN